MPPISTKPIYFGNFVVTPQVNPPESLTLKVISDRRTQVFHLTAHSFALVNLKPLLPGHVLVCPRRVTPRYSELNHAEVVDLALTVQQVGRMIERVYQASSLNIAIQDGADAGQSVPHLHTHIIPRKKADLNEKGGSDAIYGMMEGEEGDVGKHQQERSEGRPKFPVPDENSRKPRTETEMAEEAENLAREMEKEVS